MEKVSRPRYHHHEASSTYDKKDLLQPSWQHLHLVQMLSLESEQGILDIVWAMRTLEHMVWNLHKATRQPVRQKNLRANKPSM